MQLLKALWALAGAALCCFLVLVIHAQFLKEGRVREGVHLVNWAIGTTDLFQEAGDLVTECQDDNKDHIYVGSACSV
ncbi:hypothetical protein STEG23_015492, partial [Scotinomys teguina]